MDGEVKMENEKTYQETNNHRFFSIVLLVFGAALGFVTAFVGVTYALNDTTVFLYVSIAYTVMGMIFSFLRKNKQIKYTRYFFIALAILLVIEIATAITLHIALFLTLGALGAAIGLAVSLYCVINLFHTTPKNHKTMPRFVTQIIVSILIFTFLPIAILGNILIYNGGYHESFTAWDGTAIRDVSYGPKHIRNTMSFYLPKDLDPNADNEAILIIHGGSWTKGSKEQISNEGKRVAKAGYIGATMNYSFVEPFKVTMEDVLDDIDLALLKLKEENDKRGWNIKRIGVSGFSAGGHLALMYTYKRAENSPYKICFIIAKNSPAVFTRDHWKPKTLRRIAEGGTGIDVNEKLDKMIDEDEKLTYLEDVAKDISPHTYINSNIPPTLFSYAENDKLVAPTQSEDLIRLFEEKNVEYQYYVYEDSSHLSFSGRRQHNGFYDLYFKWVKKHFDRVRLENAA